MGDDPNTFAPTMAAALGTHLDVTSTSIGRTAYGLCPAGADAQSTVVARVRQTADGHSHVTLTFTHLGPTVADTAAHVSAVLAAATATHTGIKLTRPADPPAAECPP